MRRFAVGGEWLLDKQHVYDSPTRVEIDPGTRLEMAPQVEWQHVETAADGLRYVAMFVFLTEAAGSVLDVRDCVIVGPSDLPPDMRFALAMEVDMRGERPVVIHGVPTLYHAAAHLIRIRPQAAASGDFQTLIPEGPWV